MSIEVLQSKTENKLSRHKMRIAGLDCISPVLLRVVKSIGLAKTINVGDYCKSWDVLKTVELIKSMLTCDAPILDIGAYASEVLCSLYNLGYTNLTGIDLNTKLPRMPHADTIKYVVSDFMHMPFHDSSFSAITAISVLEHGFQVNTLLTELSRVLKPEGLFIASVDYWPNKINTTGIKAFGMDWCIFSRDELLAFINLAKQFGIFPMGNLNLSVSKPCVSWRGKHYTFAWCALQKKS